jgi:hypothetical protein
MARWPGKMSGWRYSAVEFSCAPRTPHAATGSTETRWVSPSTGSSAAPDAPGLVFFLGNGLLEVSGRAMDPPGGGIALWMQVRDVHAEHRRLLDAGVSILREPRREAWGLVELWIEDPDTIPIVMVEIPDDHPLRRDQRSVPALEE